MVSCLDFMSKIVTIGGGSGHYNILAGLTEYAKCNPTLLKQSDISAVVSTSDSGGHSGALIDARRDRDSRGNYLPPGDIRQCLVAFANEKTREILQHRLKHGDNKGSVVGNALLDAFYEKEGNDFEKGIEALRELFSIEGNVLPVTLERTTLKAKLSNGYEISGEDEIVHKSVWYNSPIQSISLEPTAVRANKKALEAILEADSIVLSQGSLYTSLIPSFLVKEVRDAVEKTNAKKIYVMNIVTQRGETDGFTAKKHLDVLESYFGAHIIDHVIIHNGGVPQSLRQKYENEGQQLVIDDLDVSDSRIIRTPLLRSDAPVLRHDSNKLAEIIMNVRKS